uniref:Uncharacterized protein n=1 Tax=Arundo donax TaxID=35708 RepID=A0A0A9F6I7_ARUDO
MPSSGALLRCTCAVLVPSIPSLILRQDRRFQFEG